jgi:pantothenate kinase
MAGAANDLPASSFEDDQVPPQTVTVSADGRELAELARSLRGELRRLVGITGAPGAGKSLVAAALIEHCSDRCALVPMDGFHLADAELARQGLLTRKGAPETFDVWGYGSLLTRLRSRPDHVVYAPGFDRRLEQPIAGAIAVAPNTRVVLTEGNYLLLDEPGWRDARAQLHQVWFVIAEDATRVERLVARHVEFGKSPEAAQAWVRHVDEPNARRVEATRRRADILLDLTAWAPLSTPT